MRKTARRKCKHKNADQLCGNHAADQRLCFRFIGRKVPLLPKSKVSASSHLLTLYSPVCVGAGRQTQRQIFLCFGSFNVLSLETQLICIFVFAFACSILTRGTVLCP